tara:strand:+ start:57 stop:278 length:222 start_codon:yes stop_codon:yes gene_type:complete
MSKTNIDLNKLRNGKWNLSVNIPEENLIPILKYIDKQLTIPVVVSTSCDLTETELKNKIRLADIDYHLRKERS